MPKPKVVYCSWSPFKPEEWKAAKDIIKVDMLSKLSLGDVIDIEFREVSTREPLLTDLEKMVVHKAESAYQAVKVPCLVEHAGLVLDGYEDKSYPGGLTQPMWDALGAEKFVESCAPLSTKAIARAVIGYCDGLTVKTFVGETRGHLSADARGNREFYWDTIFCPDEFDGKTYAEVAGVEGGLVEKVKISQSIKALCKFVKYRISTEPALFPGN